MSFRHRTPLTTTLLVTVAVVVGATAVCAEDAVLARQTTDLVVKVVNAASGEAVQAERILVRETGNIMTTVAETDACSDVTTFRDVGVLNHRPYVVSAWVDGVDYHTRLRGQEFLDGKAAVIHAFDSTDSLDGVRITGMNVVVRQREHGYAMEYVVTVDNQSRPQRTILATVPPIALKLPAGLEQIAVEIDRGPEAVSGALVPADGLQGVAFPLPPGRACVTITGMLPTASARRFEVAANLPVEAWSLMTWPGDLQIRSNDLKEDRDPDYGGFGRWIGEPLAANERVRVEFVAPPAEEPQEVFGQPSRPSSETTPTATDRRKTPWLTIISATVLLLAYAVWRFRRSTRSKG